MVTLYLVTLFLALVSVFPRRYVCSTTNKLLVISFDGFRWDYINQYATPNFDKLAEEGVQAQLGVRAAFTTKTFPNHYTLVTGLWEESHGIVNNRMYDPKFNATFQMGNIETRWWDGGEPVWITARLQNLKSGVYFWPGSEVKLKDTFANYYKSYKKDTPFEERVDTAIDWLKNDDIDLALVYFHEPDGAGHKCGAMGNCVKEAVLQADSLLGYITRKLQENQLQDNTNLVIVSDHGMTNITADDEHIIVLSDYLDMENEVELVPSDGVVTMVLPRKNMDDIVYTKLQNANRPMIVYKKENIPEHYHYKNNRRIMPIVILAKEGYIVKRSRPVNLSRIGPGEHGYDNDLPSMKPIFFARGPNFLPNTKLKEFDTVNIYSLLCHLLQIKAAPNNGSVEVFQEVLTEGSRQGINNHVQPLDSNLNDDNQAVNVHSLAFSTIVCCLTIAIYFS